MHAVWRFQTNQPPLGKPTSKTSETWTYARFAVICAKFLQEEAIGAEIFSDFRSEANPLYCAGSDLRGVVGGLGETSINYRLERCDVRDFVSPSSFFNIKQAKLL